MQPPPFFAWDVFYTSAVVLLCFGIYSRTKGLYELTKHKGIAHFRKAFLFFGLSYLSTFFFSFLSRALFPELPFLHSSFIPLLFILPTGYFSTVAVFYLVLGSLWKKMGNRIFVVIAHISAALLSAAAFMAHAPFLLLCLQSALLLLSFAFGVKAYAKGGKIGKMRVVYELVFVFWLVNLLVTDHSIRIHFLIKPVVQAASLILFLYIYSKITKVAGD
jgi:hypothetical protein